MTIFHFTHHIPMAETYTSISQSRGVTLIGSKKSNKGVAVVAGVLIVATIVGFLYVMSRNKDKSEPQSGLEETTQETTTIDSDKTPEEIEEVDASEKESDSNAEETPDDTNFTTDDQEVGDETVEDAKVGKFSSTSYEGFFRVTFEITSDGEFPKATAELGSGSISLKIVGLTEDKSGISPGNDADVTGSVVSRIFHEVTSQEKTSWYLIGIKKETSFYLHTLEDPKRIVLDVQEQEVENGDGQEFAFSTDSQTIDGDASGNVVKIDGLSYSNQGDVFRIIWRLGTIGTGMIPDADAEIIDYEGGKAIKLVIKNIYNDFPAGGGYDQTYTDRAVKGLVGSYSSNISTYHIKLSSQREYKLYFESAPAQLIIDVKR